MTLYTAAAYNDLCGYEFKPPVYRFEQGVLVELRCDAFGSLQKNRLITTDMSLYLKQLL